jgi:hypothetical protein
VKTSAVVALQARETGYNSPGEFVIACVDTKGVLHQYSGENSGIAAELISICQTGDSVTKQRLQQEAMQSQLEAHERGDTPEMPRHTEWRRGAVVPLVPPGADPPPAPLVIGSNPNRGKESNGGENAVQPKV